MRNKKIHPADIHQFLGGLTFPIPQKEIIDYIRNKGAPTAVIDIFKSLPPKDYNNEKEILKAINIAGHFATGRNAVKIVSAVTIPQSLPQFRNGAALLIVAGKQEAALYRAFDGTVESIASHRVPNIHYSDYEGHFKVRRGGLTISSGAVKKSDDDKIFRELTGDLKKIIDDKISPKDFKDVYIFVPGIMKNKIMAAIPLPLIKKMSGTITGDYFKAEPLTLIKKIAANRPEPAVPMKPEAKKIIDKSKKARTIIKGKE